MNRDQISAKVRRNLNDLGITYYRETDINESLQDCYDEVAVYCECIEKVTNIKLLPNTTYYNMWQIVPDYYRVIRMFSSQINGMLEINSDRTELNYRIDWELTNASARNVMILGPEFLGISGRFTDPNTLRDVKMWYKAQAPKFTAGTDIPKINLKYQILLEHYSTADLLEQNQEYKKAQLYWNQYEKLLNEYRDKIQLLSRADRVFTRSGDVMINSGDLRAYNSPESFS